MRLLSFAVTIGIFAVLGYAAYRMNCDEAKARQVSLFDGL